MEIGKVYSFDETLEDLEKQERVFAGPLADWARDRSMLEGDFIRPIHLAVAEKSGEPHNVAWLQRSLLDMDSGEVTCFYHVACDCMPAADFNGDPNIMFGCSALANMLVIRGYQVSGYFPHNTIEEGIIDVLRKDREHPQGWVANYINGQHEIVVLSVVLGHSQKEILDAAYYLAKSGEVQLLSDSVQLAA